MATRTSHENSNEIGVFAALTNAYCLTGKALFVIRFPSIDSPSMSIM
jgi:hypothetical protein